MYKSLFSFKQAEIKKAFAKARLRARMSGFKLLYAPIDQQETGKILVIASRKSGKAHKRNRIKRQIKEIFYNEKLCQTKSIFLLLVYKQAMDLTFDQIKDFIIKNIREKS